MAAKRGRDLFAKYKKIINFMVNAIKLLPKPIRMRLFIAFRGIKGKKGLALRYVFLKSIAITCGDNIAVFDNVYLLEPDKLSVGNNVSFNPMCYVECNGGVTIGDNVGLAHSVTIMSTSHEYSDTTIPHNDQPIKQAQVTIKDDVWIGCKATILYGRTIGEGAVIGANAVVTKDVDDYTIVAGVPAKEIGRRK